MPWLVTLLVILLLVAAALAVPAWQHLREIPPARPLPLRVAFASGADLVVGGGADYPFGFALAADGRRLVFPASRHGMPQLYLRDLTTGRTDALPGTDAGVLPFWSPDGAHIGFFSGGRMRAFSLKNGEVVDLAAANAPRGGAWHANGDIVFAPNADDGLYKRRASDGGVEPFGALDAAAGETSHRFPVLIADHRHIIFFVRSSNTGREGIWIAPFDAPANRQRLTASDGHGVLAGEWLLYGRDQALFAQHVQGIGATGNDLPRLTGTPLLLGTPVGRGPHNQLFATATNDVVIFGAPQASQRELRWMNRQGQLLSAVGGSVDAWDLRIAPGGTSIAVTQTDAQLGTLDVWAYDGDRPIPRRISPAIDVDELAVWSPDGTRLAWVTGRRAIAIRGAQAQLPEERVATFDSQIRVWDWSAPSNLIVITQTAAETRDDLWLVPAGGGAPPKPFAQTPFNETHGVVSPDGRWIAYAADESGTFEIYVEAFPAGGRRARLTSGGGTEPRWRSDGTEIYFRRGREIHTVAPNLTAAIPEALSSAKLFEAAGEVRAYDVSPDGQRFLLNLPAAESGAQAISVVVNWRHGLAEPRR